MTSAGYSPRKSGSRYQRLNRPSNCRAASSVLVALGGGLRRAEVEHDADLGPRGVPPDHVKGAAVGEEQMVRGAQPVGRPAETGSVGRLLVAQRGGTPRLVVGRPASDAIAQPGGDRVRVADEGIHRAARGPSTFTHESLRHVPVVQCHERLDAGVEQPVHEAVVEVEAGPVGSAGSVGKDPRPCDREPVGADSEPLHQLDVLAPPVVVVARHGRIRPVLDRPALRGVAVPHGLAAPALVLRALDLQRGRGHTPKEPFREALHRHAGSSFWFAGSGG